MDSRGSIDDEAVAPTPSMRPSPDDRDRALRLERLGRYADWLDASVGIPGTPWRVGADSIIGLVPVVGDGAGLVLSSWILIEARRLGARPGTLLRIAAYLLIDVTIGSIPLLGDLFDAGFRANQRSVRALERDLAPWVAD